MKHLHLRKTEQKSRGCMHPSHKHMMYCNNQVTIMQVQRIECYVLITE